MNQKYVVLDIETQKTAQEVEGGWNNIKDFGVAIAVCWHNDLEVFTTHVEEPTDDMRRSLGFWDLEALLGFLNYYPLVVSFNGINFDYEVLRPYGLKPELLIPKSFDILDRMKKILGHRVSLESVAQATLKQGKTGNGLEAVRLWKEGKVDAVIDYCKHDVEITRQIYEFIRENGFCRYYSLNHEVCRCSIAAS